MSYWQFFPSGEEGWGSIPVWGFASVVQSPAPYAVELKLSGVLLPRWASTVVAQCRSAGIASSANGVPRNG